MGTPSTMRAVSQQTLTRSYPAVPDSVPAARRALVAFAQEAGMAADQLDALRLAASEALTNVVRHAYGEEGGLIHLTAAIAGEELWVLVGDDGHGLEAGSHQPGLGVGLALIASVSDYFAVVKRSGGGTEVRLQFRVGDGPGRGEREFAYAPRGSVVSATSAAPSRFSTTT